MKNKIYNGNGFYSYKCTHEKCCEPRIMHQPDDINYNVSIYSNFCAYHYKVNNMKNTLIID